MAITTQILPGVYAQIIAGERQAALSARGVVAMALDLDWGAETMMLLRGGDTVSPLGYDSTASEIKLIREVLANAGTLLLYRLNSNSGQPAQGTLAAGITAKAIYNGVRGNSIKVTVTPSDDLFVIRTYLGTREMDAQAVSRSEDFKENSFIFIEGTGTLEAKSITLTGGTNGSATQAAGYEAFFAWLQNQEFNVLACTSTDTDTKNKYIAFLDKLEQAGMGKTLVINEPGMNGERIVNCTVGGGTVEYDLTAAEACATLAGIQAACGIERSGTYYPVEHWTKVSPELDRWQQETRTQAGEALFVTRNKGVYLLYDINSLISFNTDHPEDWRKNLVIRTLDSIVADLSLMLETKAVGKIRNNEDGRQQIKGMCVQILTDNYLNFGYIEDFEADDIVVETMGDAARDSIKVTAGVKVVDTADKIYLVVVSR